MLLIQLATACCTHTIAPTGQRRDGLAIALGSRQFSPSRKICEQRLFSQTCSQNAPVVAECYAATRVNGLQRALDLVGRPDCRSLRHGVALIYSEPKMLPGSCAERGE